MATLTDAQSVYSQFKKGIELVKVTYDFSVDTGAIANYIMLTASHAVIVKLVYAKVITAVTSTDALTIDFGKGNGGVEFWADKAVANLTINSLHTADAIAGIAGVYLAASGTIVMGIKAFAATAGKIEFTFEVMAI